MRALAIDVGTGTQDVLLFDSEREIENAFRLILPSPTVLVASRIRAATAARRSIVLRGRTMGGGPSSWAARDHAAAGLTIAATADAARTFDDDLAAVEALGLRVVDEVEATRLVAQGALRIELRNLWLAELQAALISFEIDLAGIDALALAVFDHGAAPPGVSDRRFRFERLRERLAAAPEAGAAAFAYLAPDIPPPFTRLAAAAAEARAWLDAAGRARVPVLAMDTGPAAAAGALEDGAARRALRAGRTVVALNVGNFHTLAMQLRPDRGGRGPARIGAIFEHHTGELRRPLLARYLRELAAGTIHDEDVFASMGHGALVLPERHQGTGSPLLTLTGPRRDLLAGHLVRGLGRPHLAVPHGDMMQAGTFGLLRALAHHVPAWTSPVESRLGPLP
ncbi:MAG: DUF1786 family protein [Candidatus Limnocylindrales bacterium]